jgi:hypothetical protein
VGFLETARKYFGGFLSGPMTKYIHEIKEGAEGFWPDKFRAEKIWWVFEKQSENFGENSY